jgi:hypothetical protein
MTMDARDFDAELDRRSALLEEARQVLPNPPRRPSSLARLETLDIDAGLKARVEEALVLSDVAGGEVSPSTILHQGISHDEASYSEDDLIKVAQFLGVTDIPAWFEELASWL